MSMLVVAILTAEPNEPHRLFRRDSPLLVQRTFAQAFPHNPFGVDLDPNRHAQINLLGHLYSPRNPGSVLLARLNEVRPLGAGTVEVRAWRAFNIPILGSTKGLDPVRDMTEFARALEKAGYVER